MTQKIKQTTKCYAKCKVRLIDQKFKLEDEPILTCACAGSVVKDMY